MSLATPSRLDRLFGTSPEEDYDRRYVAYLIVTAVEAVAS
jgi:hypothetical protein